MTGITIKKLLRNIYFRVVYNLRIKSKITRVVREKLGGFTFIVYPTVFNPKDFISSELFAEFIKSLGSLNGRRILDMGSGSGVVSVFAASLGAECIAADINPMAIRSIKENAAENGFSGRITAIESDLFEASLLKSFIAEEETKENKSNSFILFSPFGSGPSFRHFEFGTPGFGKAGEEIKEQAAKSKQAGSKQKAEESVNPGFDIIFFNPPYYKGKPKDNFELAFKGGDNLEVITRFLSEAKHYINSNGVIYFITSSDLDINELGEMITAGGYNYKIIKEIKKFFETFYVIEAVK